MRADRVGGAALLVFLTALSANAAESVFFSRSFPGSAPAYFEVEIDGSGKAVYREEPDEEDPLEFQLSEDESAKLFEQLRALDFEAGLASDRKKIASSGKKVLRYTTSVGETVEAAYDYSEAIGVREVTSWFAHIAETERHLMELERVVQFDRLGVNGALLAFQKAYEADRIVAPQQFVPILQKIVDQSGIVHMARSRAAGLLERINGLVASE